LPLKIWQSLLIHYASKLIAKTKQDLLLLDFSMPSICWHSLSPGSIDRSWITDCYAFAVKIWSNLLPICHLSMCIYQIIYIYIYIHTNTHTQLYVHVNSIIQLKNNIFDILLALSDLFKHISSFVQFVNKQWKQSIMHDNQ